MFESKYFQSQSNLLDLSKLAKVQPHVPLIRFRKGLPSIPEPSLDNTVVSQPTTFEWWERPEKYSRPSLDDKEIELINSGGAEVTYQ